MSQDTVPIFDSDRCLFSFRNGIFNARNGFSYITAPGMGTNELRNIQTVNYFDTYLTGEHLLGSIDDIQTPCFDKLLLDQRYGPKDLYWFQAILGRTLHDVGTMDDWKVSLYEWPGVGTLLSCDYGPKCIPNRWLVSRSTSHMLSG